MHLAGLAALLPPNGLDRSLHAAVLIGLLIGTFFAETLGWTFAGLVVPGYLATVFVAAPVTGALVVVEAIVTYLFTALIGQTLPKTGAWSTAFGRERFYLFIVNAVIVRLVLEGWVLPRLAERYVFAHSRELYGIGLVLVPLVANSFWNAGLWRTLPRAAVVTGGTYLALVALLATTNLSVSRFQVLNESVSLAFFDAPKTQVILVVGALLGARHNVRHGWDYNGILVPGLLAVAWYEPTKLVTTTVEAVVVYLLAVGLTSVRPLSRLLIVGQRRTVFAFLLGFTVKLLSGYVAARYWPGVSMITMFGFGYLLPTLLAVKMWSRGRVGVVLMPTLQVSLTAFVVGNVVGFGLAAIGGSQAAAADRPPIPTLLRASPAAELVLGDVSPRPARRVVDAAESTEAEGVVLRLAADVLRAGRPDDATLVSALAASLRVTASPEGGWVTVVPRSVEPDDDPLAPRLAVRPVADGAAGALIVAYAATPGSPMPAAALRLAGLLGANAVVVISRHPQVRPQDEELVERLAPVVHAESAMVLAEGARARLSVRGSLPHGFGAVGLARAFGAEVPLVWEPAPGPAAPVLDRAIRLVVPAAVAGELAAAELGAAPIEPWGGTIREQLVGRLDALTSVGPAGFRGPTIEELRVIGDAILPRLFDLSAGGAPTPWDRAIAALVGYRFVAIGDGELPEAFALVETASDRRGHPTVVVRVRPSSAGAKVASRGTVVEVPAPRWEVGVAGAGTAVFEAIDADALLLAGSLPNADAFGGADPRRADSRRSVFHRVHELWLGSGGSAVSLQGIAPERAVAVDAVVSFGAEMFDRTQEPAWSLPLRALLDDLGLAVRVYDGTRELAPFSGAPDVALAYAKRFAEGQCAIVYLSPAIREAFARADRDRSLEPRLTRSGVKVRRADVVARAGDLARCVDPKACEADHCELDAVERSIEAYTGQGNPFDLRSGLRDPGACFVEVARDTVTGRIFAIAARRGEARVLPLAIGATRRAVGPFGPAARSRSVADVGIFPLRVAEAP